MSGASVACLLACVAGMGLASPAGGASASAEGAACRLAPADLVDLQLPVGVASESILLAARRERVVLPLEPGFAGLALALASHGSVPDVTEVLSFDETTLEVCVHVGRVAASLDGVLGALALGVPAPNLLVLSSAERTLVAVETTRVHRVDLDERVVLAFLLLAPEGTPWTEAMDVTDDTRTRRLVVQETSLGESAGLLEAARQAFAERARVEAVRPRDQVV